MSHLLPLPPAVLTRRPLIIPLAPLVRGHVTTTPTTDTDPVDTVDPEHSEDPEDLEDLEDLELSAEVAAVVVAVPVEDMATPTAPLPRHHSAAPALRSTFDL